MAVLSGYLMKTYQLLERITDDLATMLPDAAARYSYCWRQASELTEALLDDLEAVTDLRGYVQHTQLLLYSTGRFSRGEFFLSIHFDPHDQFSVRCYCHLDSTNRIRLQVLNEADSRHLQRAAKLLSGPDYDDGWVELNTLKN